MTFLAKKKSKKKVKKNKKKTLHPLMFEIIGLLILGIAVISFFEYGLVGEVFAYIGYFLFGNWHIAIPFLFVTYALIIMIKQSFPPWNHRLLLSGAFILSSLLIFSHLALFEQLFDGKKILEWNNEGKKRICYIIFYVLCGATLISECCGHTVSALILGVIAIILRLAVFVLFRNKTNL